MSLCPLGDKTYEHITTEWLKLSPEAAELYVSYLIPLELKSIENKINIKNFIFKFSEAFCNKQSGEEFGSLIHSGIESINLCLLRNDMPYCKRDKIRRLLIDIEYNLYYNKIIEVSDQTDIVGENNPSPPTIKKVNYDLIQSGFNKKPILQEDIGYPLDPINVTSESIPDVMAESIPDVIAESIPDVMAESIPDVMAESIPEVKTYVKLKPESKIEIKISELILIIFILIFLGLILLIINKRHIKFNLYDVE